MLLHSYLGIYTCTEHIYIDTCMYAILQYIRLSIAQYHYCKYMTAHPSLCVCVFVCVCFCGQ